jgi:hypothetical protein
LWLSPAGAADAVGVDDQLDGSAVVSVLASPESPTQQAFQRVVGDEVLDTLLALAPLIGERNVVLDGDDSVEIPPAEAPMN